MTPANATAVEQMRKEIRLLCWAESNQHERGLMLLALERACNDLWWENASAEQPTLDAIAHEREIKKADDRRKVREENQ